MNKRGATIKGITRDCLKEIRLNLPPFPEQKKIAHILSTVQRAIEAQEKIIQTTTELKKALMHKLFTEGLRNEPQKQTEIGPVPESWEIKFLAYQLGIDSIQQYVAMNKRGATIKGITRDCLKEIRLNLPPFPEQKKIAHILSTVQRAIEAQEKIIQTTTELKKALMHKLFTEGLRNEPQKQTEIGPVPESWEIKKIGEIAQLKSGGTPSRKKPAYWDGGDINWIKTREIDYCRIVKAEEKITKAGLVNSSAKIFPAGTLLVAMYGQGVTRGKVAITGLDAATNQACAAIFPLAEVRTKYLYYFLEYNYDKIRSFAHGANQKNLSAELIKSFPITFPSVVDEQKEITDSLKIFDRRIAVSLTKKSQIQYLFRTLLFKLMTAKIRVYDIDLHQQKTST